MWQEALDEVDQLTDNLGRGLDPDSRELVAALRLFGLQTVMSCWGHPERATQGPYVMFRSLEASALEEQYWKLVRAGERKSTEAIELRGRALDLNLTERRKITPMLDLFYVDRPTAYGSRIIITTFDLGGSRLKCQAAEEYRFIAPEDRPAFLALHQQEFSDFGDFLQCHLNIKNPTHLSVSGGTT